MPGLSPLSSVGCSALHVHWPLPRCVAAFGHPGPRERLSSTFFSLSERAKAFSEPEQIVLCLIGQNCVHLLCLDSFVLGLVCLP